MQFKALINSFKAEVEQMLDFVEKKKKLKKEVKDEGGGGEVGGGKKP